MTVTDVFYGPHLRELQPQTQALGLPGELQWIEIASLQVDDDYQRPISRFQVNKLKREWDNDLIGVILISEREDGSRYILDGQHRVQSLIEMGYRDERVPAMVYRHLSIETEAKIFALANKNRLYLSPQYAFRARLLAGDKLAHAINDTVQVHGYHINYWKNLPGQEPGMSKPEGMLTCVGELESLQTDYAGDMLTKVMVICEEVWGNLVIGLSASVLRGIAMFVSNFETTMDRDRFLGVLRNTTPQGLVAMARDLGAAKNAPTAITRVLIQRYNHHLSRQNRLPERGLRKQNQRRG